MVCCFPPRCSCYATLGRRAVPGLASLSDWGAVRPGVALLSHERPSWRRQSECHSNRETGTFSLSTTGLTHCPFGRRRKKNSVYKPRACAVPGHIRPGTSRSFSRPGIDRFRVDRLNPNSRRGHSRNERRHTHSSCNAAPLMLASTYASSVRSRSPLCFRQ